MTKYTLENRARRLHHVEDVLRTHMFLYDFQPIDLPVLESAQVFLTRASDTIIRRLFTFERSGRDIAMRPEFTAIAAHYYVQNALAGTQRWQFRGPIFEDDPDFPSREQQRPSIGAEIIGLVDAATEAEAIAMAYAGLEKLALPDLQLLIGHVGALQALLAELDLDSRTMQLILAQRDHIKRGDIQKAEETINRVVRTDGTSSTGTTLTSENEQTHYMLDVLLDSTRYGTTMGGRTRIDIARRLLHKHTRTIDSERIRDALQRFTQWIHLSGPVEETFDKVRALSSDNTYQRACDRWMQTVTHLEAFGVTLDNVRIQPDLTKNWEYYTGLVFGVRQNETFIVGGGRYDDLVHYLGGSADVQAFGFAYYVDQFLNQIGGESEVSIPPILVDGEDLVEIIRVVQQIRQLGFAAKRTAADHDSPPLRLTASGLTWQEHTYSREDLTTFIAAWKEHYRGR